MPCNHVRLPNGFSAIVCTPTRRCACGRTAPLLCDWKVPTKKSGTCDRPLCNRCALHVGTDKHLCPKHAIAFREWKAGREGQDSVKPPRFDL